MEPTEVAAATEMMRLLNGVRVTQALAVAARLGIADLLTDGARSSDDLASAVGAHPDALYRLLRALASLGVFAEEDGRRFAQTPLSAALREGHPASMRAHAIFLGDEISYHTWADLAYTITTDAPSFDHIYGEPHFDYLATHPAAAETFNRAMSASSVRIAAAVTAGYDFTGAQVVVDVGGGQGALLAAILRANPSLRGTLFDLPHVVATAEPVLRAAEVTERVEVVGGDFFTAALPRGDILTMHHILHDWDDDHCVLLLRNCLRALEPDGKVLTLEAIVQSGIDGAENTFRDLQMMALNGGRERTAAEFERLFRAAGLRLTRVIPTTTPAVSIIEGVQLGS